MDRLTRLAGMQVVLYRPDLGRIATVRGDIQHARHVAVFVPGTGSSFDDFLEGTNGTDNTAREIHREADLQAPGDVAVISWLGYDAPPSIPDAAFPGRAEDGGRLLSSFTRHMGLGDGQALTLVGHSYGSTVVGHGVIDGAPARDIVVLGSPGIDAGQRNVLDRAAGLAGAATEAVRDRISELEDGLRHPFGR